MKLSKRLVTVLSLFLVLSFCVGTVSYAAKRRVVFLRHLRMDLHNIEDETHEDEVFILALPKKRWVDKWGDPKRIICTTNVDEFKADKIERNTYFVGSKKCKGCVPYNIIFYDDDACFDGDNSKAAFIFEFYWDDGSGDEIVTRWTLSRNTMS